MEKQTVNVPLDKIYAELNKTTEMMYDSMKMFDKINRRLIIALVILMVSFTTLLTTYILCVYTVTSSYEQELETENTRLFNKGGI